MTESKPIPLHILEQAADWLVLIHSGQMTTQQQQQYQAWKTAHPDHQSAIERVTRFTSGLSELPKTINQDKLLNSKQSFRNHLSQKLILVFTPLCLSVAAYQYFPWQLWQADITSKTGEVKTLHLEDGSTLTLASNSYVNIHFDEQQRQIELLKGEVYIQTAKEPTRTYRPFTVNTPNGNVQALGTRFSVRQDQYNSDTDVQVYQHAVAIRPAQDIFKQKTIIHQGHTAQFNQYNVQYHQNINNDVPYIGHNTYWLLKISP